MKSADFDFVLPEARIARYPPEQRTDSRLLLVNSGGEHFSDQRFVAFPQQLHAGDLLVLNDTQVLPARLIAYKPSGGRVELLLERALDEQHMLMQARANHRLKSGTVLQLAQGIELHVQQRVADLYQVRICAALNVADVLQHYGSIPLPPYLKRAPTALDRQRYQTVYARHPGAVAAPTAGLHFSLEMLQQIKEAGVNTAWVTLHVGAATFKPLHSENISDHTMHPETVRVTQQTVDAISATRMRGKRVIAVGTTTVRSLEACCASGAPRPLDGETNLFIYPGYRFRCVDALLTNFHLPRSTLLMLVCAFAGTQRVLTAYRHAVALRYRFYSYGDAMFIARTDES